jgi:DNA recombination protein RmuC
VATPTTLIALLRTVAASWQQHEQAENARKIAEAGADLYDRICKFIEHIGKLRRGLETAVGAYNEATGSFQRMLLPGARRLQELRVVPETKALPEVEGLDAALRPAPDQPAGKQP